MGGEQQCGWSSWFKSHFQYEKRSSDFDLAAWTVDHNNLVNTRADMYRNQGYVVYLEDQNSFMIEGSNGAILSGKPDLIAVKGNEAIIEDAKTGQQRHSDLMQVLCYMVVGVKHIPHCAGKNIIGIVKYRNSDVVFEPEKVDDTLLGTLKNTMEIVASDIAPEKVPSYMECRFCDISSYDCDKRIDSKPELVKDAELF